MNKKKKEMEGAKKCQRSVEKRRLRVGIGKEEQKWAALEISRGKKTTEKEKKGTWKSQVEFGENWRKQVESVTLLIFLGFGEDLRGGRKKFQEGFRRLSRFFEIHVGLVLVENSFGPFKTRIKQNRRGESNKNREREEPKKIWRNHELSLGFSLLVFLTSSFQEKTKTCTKKQRRFKPRRTNLSTCQKNKQTRKKTQKTTETNKKMSNLKKKNDGRRFCFGPEK